MLALGVTFFAAFSCCKFVIANDEGLDIIVQKYKALGYSEISDVKNERYQFRFCACEGVSNWPESDANCACSRTEDAEFVQKSVPHALYPSSCIHTPKQNKCLVGSIASSPKQKDLYVKVSVDRASLTDPPYQKIRESRFKSNVRLTCSKESSCENCIPCKNGFIELVTHL
ncbi:unnamed protein product [Toxocara canis]|uniref:Secreted protein n=1 Tax=Toxocara canis TaxID=6265 RepID=A0A183U1Q1_TOXCA|nr:unnamed protein product [Toxocara canis]